MLTLLSAVDARYELTRRDVLLAVCLILCAEVVGATSSGGFLYPYDH